MSHHHLPLFISAATKVMLHRLAMVRKLVDLALYPEVQKYIGRDVVAVELPPRRKEDDTYPPFILDGASGVGKTQQAFSLLKKHKSMVYVVLAASAEQNIYNDMNDICGVFRGFIAACKKGMDEARQIVGDETDAFSPKNLADTLKLDLLRPMLTWMANAFLSLHSEEQLFVGFDEHVETWGANEFQRVFADQVLFVDEALPKASSDDYKELLRFVRNCGRMLKMRVVPAGTAAVVANMIASTGPTASRNTPEKSDVWASCHFLWNPIKEEEMSKNESIAKYATFQQMDTVDLQNILLGERPLLVHKFLENDADDIFDRLNQVGSNLCSQKRVDDKPSLKTIWLSGAWLAEQTGWATSPHKVTPPDLVRGHFFEPAMASLRNGMPHLQSGIAQLENVAGPLTATVYHIIAKDTERQKSPLWVLAANYGKGTDSREVAGVAEKFYLIKEALSSCVQQCLVREPLLAVALSFQHRLDEDDFMSGIHDCFQTSISERSLGSMSGEQLELIIFAALQLANGQDYYNPATVSVFCERLVKYLSPNDGKEDDRVKASVAADLSIPDISYLPAKHKGKPCQYEYPDAFAYAEEFRKEKNAAIEAANAKLDPGTPKFPIDDSPIPQVLEAKALTEESIPWLVPACATNVNQRSLPGLRKLFKNKNIAALLPGSKNSACDIDAYQWPPCDVGAPKLLWRFEVKGRSNKYALKNGVKDLIKKCGDDSSKEGLHHAMLIAVRRQWETATCMWTVRKGNQQYLRVVLLVSGL